MHAPLLSAVKDIFPEEKMWELISECDINHYWSGTIIQNKGELRVYFCEVAASFDLARNQDNGHPLIQGWWKFGIQEYEDQILRFCPGCGAPGRFKGVLDKENVDIYTKTNVDLVNKSLKRKRKIVEFDESFLQDSSKPMTIYSSVIKSKFGRIRAELGLRQRIRRFFS